MRDGVGCEEGEGSEEGVRKVVKDRARREGVRERGREQAREGGGIE